MVWDSWYRLQLLLAWWNRWRRFFLSICGTSVALLILLSVIALPVLPELCTANESQAARTGGGIVDVQIAEANPSSLHAIHLAMLARAEERGRLEDLGSRERSIMLDESEPSLVVVLGGCAWMASAQDAAEAEQFSTTVSRSIPRPGRIR